MAALRCGIGWVGDAGVVGRWLGGLIAAAALAGCTVPVAPPAAAPPPADFAGALSAEQAARTFVYVVDRVVPVAEAICLERTRDVPCSFQIAIDERPGQAPNAFQTLDNQGNPIIAFNIPLLMDIRNPDELAFVMGHETAHHIAGHIARQQTGMMQGALVAGALATLGGGDEADALGTEIAWRAGFDPLVGAQFFSRLPDPGNRFLGTHPPTAQRYEVVEQTLQRLR
jgi:Zn-dependent protease with chaperone function